MSHLLAGAAMLVLSSHYHELSAFSVLDAMGAGVVATRTGGVPELIGPDRCVPMGDAPPLGERMRALWEQPDLRRDEGEALLARTRERHSEERYLRELLGLYEQARGVGGPSRRAIRSRLCASAAEAERSTAAAL